jgi:hypothetical protein
MTMVASHHGTAMFAVMMPTPVVSVALANRHAIRSDCYARLREGLRRANQSRRRQQTTGGSGHQ